MLTGLYARHEYLPGGKFGVETSAILILTRIPDRAEDAETPREY